MERLALPALACGGGEDEARVTEGQPGPLRSVGFLHSHSKEIRPWEGPCQR